MAPGPMAPPTWWGRFDTEFARVRDALDLVVTGDLTMRVLIADDDVTSRLMLQAIVSKLGHECLVANDGSRAWELLSSEVDRRPAHRLADAGHRRPGAVPAGTPRSWASVTSTSC